MKHLVIAGGGYGGIKVITLLLDKGLPKDVTITLIDRFPHHSLKTEFYALAAGTISDKETRIAFPVHPQVNYIFDEIKEINVTDKNVSFVQKETISYDYLVVGLGAEDNYHGIQGAEEFTHSVQNMGKARKTYEAIQNTKGYGQISIVGGGLTGIEIASELRESRPDLNIRLLDRGDSILRGFPQPVIDYATKWFDHHHVELVHNAHIDYIEEGVLCNNNECLLTDVTVWSAGIQPNKIVRDMKVEKDQQGRVVINEFFQVPAHPEVYIVGDCASSAYPTTAQVAKQQGKRLTAVLLDVLHGKEPKKPSDIKLKGTMGSLGKVDGFGVMSDMPMKGFVPRVVKSGVLWLHRFTK